MTFHADMMKRVIFMLILVTGRLAITAQSIDDISFGTDSTFEIVTWNIERFPKNGQTTVDHVKAIMEALDADIFALQEVQDTIQFRQMVNSMDAYQGYLESSYFAGLAYVYKPAVVRVSDIFEIYTTSPYWNPFPRSPMVMDLTIREERFVVINNHFKCCGDGILNLSDPKDEETRRYEASNLLKAYVDAQFPNDNVLVAGDLNDVLSDSQENNVFQQFLDDNENYRFADYEIATGGNSEWSFPNWPSHLDHILITNEVFDEFENTGSGIQTVKLEAYFAGGWSEYDQKVSDHRPVGLRLKLNVNMNSSSIVPANKHFFNYPNPFGGSTMLVFDASEEPMDLRIYNINGQVVHSEVIPSGVTSVHWDGEGYPRGIYLARLLRNRVEVANTKLIMAR